jgi:hypothetical protein
VYREQFLADLRAGSITTRRAAVYRRAVERSGPVVSGGMRDLAADSLASGTYAVVCVALDEHKDIITAYIAGP